MNPAQHVTTTNVLGAPKGWRPELGVCLGLPVTRYQNDLGGNFASYWRPSADELAALAGGSLVCLNVVGDIHPPVLVSVEGVEPAGEFRTERLPELAQAEAQLEAMTAAVEVSTARLHEQADRLRLLTEIARPFLHREAAHRTPEDLAAANAFVMALAVMTGTTPTMIEPPPVGRGRRLVSLVWRLAPVALRLWFARRGTL